MDFLSSWNEAKFWIIIHFMDSHNFHIQVAYFLHEMKWNFDSLFLMDSHKIHTSFVINWNEILIHYFFHGLKWYVFQYSFLKTAIATRFTFECSLSFMKYQAIITYIWQVVSLEMFLSINYSIDPKFNVIFIK